MVGTKTDHQSSVDFDIILLESVGNIIISIRYHINADEEDPIGSKHVQHYFSLAIIKLLPDILFLEPLVRLILSFTRYLSPVGLIR